MGSHKTGSRRVGMGTGACGPHDRKSCVAPDSDRSSQPFTGRGPSSDAPLKAVSGFRQ